MEKFVIAILVDNQPGVLTRISSMFTRRGFNIDSLTVGETEDPNLSRITIVTHGDDSVRKQIIKQCKKLYNVMEVKVMDEEQSVKRELAFSSPAARRSVSGTHPAVLYNAQSNPHDLA